VPDKLPRFLSVTRTGSPVKREDDGLTVYQGGDLHFVVLVGEGVELPPETDEEGNEVAPGRTVAQVTREWVWGAEPPLGVTQDDYEASCVEEIKAQLAEVHPENVHVTPAEPESLDHLVGVEL